MITIKEVEEKIIAGYNISETEALYLQNNIPTILLCECANQIRIHFKGEVINTCTIMNAKSGLCSENCKWCSQSAHHKTGVEIYPLIRKEAAIEQALYDSSKGVQRFSLVTSGRALTRQEVDKCCDMYRSIRAKSSIGLCASMGLLNKEELLALKESGIEHYHCNIETAPSFFPNVCSTHSIEDKFRTIQWAKEIGLKICSGGIIGMGETMEQRIEMALTLRELGVASIPVNILNPIEGTALEGAQQLSDEEMLRTFALFRLINPKVEIRFAGGRSRIAHIQEQALKSGVSAALVGDLLTTLGSNIEEDFELFSRCGFQTR